MGLPPQLFFDHNSATPPTANNPGPSTPADYTQAMESDLSQFRQNGGVQALMGEIIRRRAAQATMPTDSNASPLSPDMGGVSPVVPNAPQSQRPGVGGTLKRMLTNYVQGLGEELTANTRLTNSTINYHNALAASAVQNANTSESYRQMQERGLQSAMEPYTLTSDMTGLPYDIPTTRKDAPTLLKQIITNKGKTDVANINQGMQIPLSPDLAQQVGRPDLAGKQLPYKSIKGLLGITGANHTLTAVGDRLQIRDKSDGRLIADLGQNPQLAARVASAEAFAKTKAAYTPFSTIDTDPDSATYGQPVTISNLQALQTAAVPGGKINTQQILTGLTGLDNYRSALTAQKDSIGVLSDNTQRAAIAQTLKALSGTHEMGVIDSFLNAKLQQGLLTPDAVKFVGATKLAQEFIGANRQFAGNMRGSQALYNTMISNVASPAMSPAIAQQFIDQDLAATKNIENRFSFRRPRNAAEAAAMAGHPVKTATAPASPPASTAPSTGSFWDNKPQVQPR